MGQAAEAMKAGVQAVNESPTAKAADNADKYARNTQEAVTSGRFQAACRAVSTEEWKSATITKGVPSMQNAVRNLSIRAKRNQADQLAFANQVSNEISSMPNQTEADAEARMLAAVRKMRGYKKNG